VYVGIIRVTGVKQTAGQHKYVVQSTELLQKFILIMKSQEVNIGKAVLVCCNVVFLVSSVIADHLSKLLVLVFYKLQV
jgi:hypothetical protein